MIRLKKEDIKDCKDIYEVMEKAKINFNPIKKPIKTIDGTDCPNNKAIVRSDTGEVLSVMSNSYTPIAPSKSFALIDNIVKDYNAQYTSIISINNGRKILINAEAEGVIDLGDGDILKKRIIFKDSFDGSLSFEAEYGLYRALCSNLQLWKAKNVKGIKIRHTTNAEHRLMESVRVWDRSKIAFYMWEEKAKFLNQKIIDHNQVENFLNSLLEIDTNKKVGTQKQNTKDTIKYLFENGKGNKGNSAWDLYNGATEFYDHRQGSDTDKRTISSIIGHGAMQKSKAFDLALSI